MFQNFLTTALSYGFYSPYVLADAWFSSKSNIRSVLSHDLTAIMMMKRNKTKYRYKEEDLTLKGLYRKLKKSDFKKNSKYQYATINVEFNLAEPNEPVYWQTVRLLFSRANNSPKGSWVVIMCTDQNLSAEKIFEVYALRWSIECYFKEVKQHFNFLKEQSGDYVVHYASIHLAAMRYILLFHISLTHVKTSFSESRKLICERVELNTFGLITWNYIKPLVYSILDQYLDDVETAKLKQAINEQVNEFFVKALQMDPQSIRSLQAAEKYAA